MPVGVKRLNSPKLIGVRGEISSAVVTTVAKPSNALNTVALEG
jgi:hypothetical protein